MTLHAPPAIDPQYPPRWRLSTSSLRVLADDPLTNFKTCNKLPHVLARTEAESHGADEALLLNCREAVTSATSGNVFWIEDQRIYTPPLASGALPGVTRAVVMGLCAELGLTCQERQLSLAELRQAQGAFLTLSTWEIVEVASLDAGVVPQSLLVEKLRVAYRHRVGQEIQA
jgi:branched-subunit amino acid aminotransferase/4-amino-4-deoxychorismate lyase